MQANFAVQALILHLLPLINVDKKSLWTHRLDFAKVSSVELISHLRT